MNKQSIPAHDVETDFQIWCRKEEKRTACVFLLGLAAIYAVWFLTTGRAMSARVGACGGLIAFIGVVVMAWPVLRVGVFQWKLNVVWKSVSLENTALSAEQEQEFRHQRAKDLINQNVFGPYLVGIGTIINGFCGLF